MKMLRNEASVELMNQNAQGSLPGYLGVEMIELDERQLKSRMAVQPFHLAPNGFLHAASVVALADSTCGFAALAHLPEGAMSFTTIELKSNHMSTIREGSVACTAKAQHLGKNTQVWDATVSDEATGKAIALFRCTQMVLWPR
ncbi:PaaI family thioesterase [Pseudomonas sp. RC10]|uniref:PaaI family thioesterase n=1 Tax=Pseudomonas bambusae TaxID=3139142 RepID=UPI00313867CF